MRNKRNIRVTGGGIQCDNPVCDYRDDSVPMSDYVNWVDKPCPCCGANLLTKEDYEAVRTVLATAYVVNQAFQDRPLSGEEKSVVFRFNGTGKPDCEII